MFCRWIFTSASVHCSRSVCNQIYLFVLLPRSMSACCAQQLSN